MLTSRRSALNFSKISSSVSFWSALQTWLKFWQWKSLSVLIFHIWSFNSRWSHGFHLLMSRTGCYWFYNREIYRIATHWISITWILLLPIIFELSDGVKRLIFFLNLISNFEKTIQLHGIMMTLFYYHIWKVEAVFKRIKYPFTWPEIFWLTHLKFFICSYAFLDNSHIWIELWIKGPNIFKSFFWSLPALNFFEKTQVS